MIKIIFDRSITPVPRAHTHTHTRQSRHIFSIKRKRIHHVVFDILAFTRAYITHNKKALIEFIENDIEMLCHLKPWPLIANNAIDLIVS